MAAAAVLVIAATALAILVGRWPLSEGAVVRALEEASASTVRIERFHSSHFPHPGCVAQGVTFRREGNPSGPPLMTVQRLVIWASFTGLLTKHIGEIRAEGLYLRIPPLGTKPKLGNPGGRVIDKIVLNGATVEFGTLRPRRRQLRFDIHESAFTPVEGAGPTEFSARLRIPEPPGEVSLRGRVGPWKAHEPGRTPLKGSYAFGRAMLGAVGGVGGTLSSQGSFSGTLERIEVKGGTDTPDFKTKAADHRIHLSTRFRATVNGRNGDTFLEPVDAQLHKTKLVTRGSVAGARRAQRVRLSAQPDESSGRRRGKTASLDMQGTGRVEDLLWLFVREDPPSMAGAINFKARISVPPGRQRFLRKANLQGDFMINSGIFAKRATQLSLETLSARLRHEKRPRIPESVSTDLKGHVVLNDGIATISNLSANIPGASAELSGTYNLLNQRINLHGILHMQAPPSETARGIKSVLMRTLDRFFKKGKRDFVVPFRIAGTYDNPSFGLDLGSQK